MSDKALISVDEMRGSESELIVLKAAQMIDYVKSGYTIPMALRKAHLSAGKFYDLQKAYPDYFAAVEAARTEREKTALDKISNHQDWRAQTYLLSKLRPEEFTQEGSTGSIGGIQVIVNIGEAKAVQAGETITITPNRVA